MPICFTHLKIAGFKSFADTTALDILPGLTGIVGPNGCGKSNIVEAIRWVMGESSARSLRGGEMDDVIFAGTSRRTAHNIAEVTLTLEKTEERENSRSDQNIPAPFQQQGQIEISRQIERNAGSQYHLNGKSQRARDIQTLFADIGSGPRSSAIISQNRIAQLISASPEERRQVLEEAAGISGLHNRRREAELKLKATEENLSRLHDLKQQLEQNLNELQEQSVQATSYRSISASLRNTETRLQTLYYQRAESQLHHYGRKISEGKTNLKEKEQSIQTIQQKQQDIHVCLAQLRQEETKARIQWETQKKQLYLVQNQQKEITQTLEQLHERLKETQDRQKILQNHIQKNRMDQNTLLDQIAIIDLQLNQYPIEKGKLEHAIQVLEAENQTLVKRIKQAEAEFNVTRQHNQQLLQTLEQARQSKQDTEKEYERVSQDYQNCLKNIPEPDNIQEKEAILHSLEKRLQEMETVRQTLTSELQAAELNANNISYQVRQIQEKHQNLDQEISQKKQQKQKQETDINSLQKQITRLEILLSQTATQENTRQALANCQNTLHKLGEQIKTITLDHQQSIKKRLQQESLYSQSVQTYEQTTKTLQQAETDHQQAQTSFAQLKNQIETLASHFVPVQKIQEKQDETRNIEKQLKQNQKRISQLEQDSLIIAEKTDQQKSVLNQHQMQIQTLQAQRDGLKQVLWDTDQLSDPCIPAALDLTTLSSTWIPAIAAIFDKTIEAPVCMHETKGWAKFDIIRQDFPIPLPTLAERVPTPLALQRIFTQIGIVQSQEEGNRLFPLLKPGQILVTQQGDIWRWDGYYQTREVQNKITQRLLQKQNLQQIETELQNRAQRTDKLQHAYDEVQKEQTTFKNQLDEARNQQKKLESLAQTSSKTLFTLQNQAQSIKTRWDALQPAFQQAKKHLENRKEFLIQAQKTATMPRPDKQELNRAQQVEQENEQILEKKQLEFQNTEKKLAFLKDQYQQQLNENEKSRIHLETLQNRLDQYQTNYRLLNDQLTTCNQKLNETETPEKALQNLENAQNIIHKLQTALSQVTGDLQKTELKTRQAQHDFQALKEYMIQQKSRMETLQPRHQALQAELENASITLQHAKTAFHDRRDDNILESNLAKLQKEHKNCQETKEKKLLDYHLLLNEHKNLDTQKESLMKQQTSWQLYLAEIQHEQEEVTQKIRSFENQITKIKDQPIQLQKKQTEMQNTVKMLDSRWQELQNKLVSLEQQKQEAEQDFCFSEQQKNKIRENLLKTQAKHEQAEAFLTQLKNNSSEEVLSFSIQNPKLDLTEQAEKQLKNSIITLTEERAALGAVNLRAELEFQEKGKQLAELETQYVELTTAIQQLRESIHKLNQQGKNKLSAIFNEVNQHFQELFRRMFNGGQAYLKLLTHEDPLQSGLEIYAQPPGKKLSTLSLLSGGEQALTALSLVFAVGRCNPVPICILDEVDAPLDDPNVERFCNLLSDMTRQAGTRFLVVTHHQLTMSHMNRLYGITMQERGISQIISIDLENAVKIQQSKQHEQLEFS